MPLPSLPSLLAGFIASAACCAALAASDVGTKPPAPPPNPIVDKSPRCAPSAVTQCRSSCERKKIEASDKDLIAKKRNECKQDCIRGC